MEYPIALNVMEKVIHVLVVKINISWMMIMVSVLSAQLVYSIAQYVVL